MIEIKIGKYKITGINKYNMNILIKEVFKNEDYYFEAKNNTPFIIDCGSNIGMASLYFKKLYPKCKILSFEANKQASDLYLKNMKDNKIRGYEHHNIALINDDSESIDFFIDSADSVVGSINSDRGGKTKITCKAGRLSDYMTYCRVDLLKMDIEGSEWDVVYDLDRNNILKTVEQAFIEYHHGIKGKEHNFGSFLNIFEENGFKYNLLSEYVDDNGFQDIFVHFYRG